MSRTALVSGGNRGIGLAIARELAVSGDRVAVTHRGNDPAEGLFGVLCDVTEPADVQDAFTTVENELGTVEVVVANAGITRDKLLATMSEEDFISVLDTNLTGAYRVIKRAVRSMLRLRRGRIVLVSSNSALSGSAGQTNYAAGKAGMIGFARSLARELAPRGITVNVVTPGWIDTSMTRALPEEARTQALQSVPLGRYGTAEEVAKVVRFLSSADASYVTGAVIPVDGGNGMGY